MTKQTTIVVIGSLRVKFALLCLYCLYLFLASFDGLLLFCNCFLRFAMACLCFAMLIGVLQWCIDVLQWLVNVSQWLVFVFLWLVGVFASSIKYYMS